MNSNVTLVTNENDLQVKYGMYSLCDEREQARGSLKYILSDVHDIKTGYFRLGFHLHEFKTCEYYKDFGYLTFEEFCENNLDMDKGAISRCINVFLMTTSQGEITYSAGYKTIGCAGQMSDKYKDYSYSQLCEMLPLDDEKRAKVSPDMTIKEIRELKKSNKSIKVATSQLEEDGEEDLTPLYVAADFEKDEFLNAMFVKFREALEYLSLEVCGFERSGKQLSFKDEDGGEYRILFRVMSKESKKKEG